MRRPAELEHACRLPLPASTGGRTGGWKAFPCPSVSAMPQNGACPCRAWLRREAPPTYRRKAVLFLPLQYWLAEITSPAPVRSGGVWGCYFGFTEDTAWQEANTFQKVEQPLFYRWPPICRRLASSLLWKQGGEGAGGCFLLLALSTASKERFCITISGYHVRFYITQKMFQQSNYWNIYSYKLLINLFNNNSFYLSFFAHWARRSSCNTFSKSFYLTRPAIA